MKGREKEIIEKLGHPVYTAEFVEQWIGRNDNVYANAPAALQAMGAKGFYEAVQCMADFPVQCNLELIKLIGENPELPVVPMVSSEVVADSGYAYWIGSFSKARVAEYFIGEECIHFREDDDLDEVLAEAIGWDKYESMPDDEARKAYEELPWIKAIIVYISTP